MRFLPAIPQTNGGLSARDGIRSLKAIVPRGKGGDAWFGNFSTEHMIGEGKRQAAQKRRQKKKD